MHFTGKTGMLIRNVRVLLGKLHTHLLQQFKSPPASCSSGGYCPVPGSGGVNACLYSSRSSTKPSVGFGYDLPYFNIKGKLNLEDIVEREKKEITWCYGLIAMMLT